MNAREEAISLLRNATKVRGEKRLHLMVTAGLRHLDAMDEDLQKLRKELRTRNGGSDAA